MKEQIIKKRLNFNGTYIRVWNYDVELENGTRANREIVEKKYSSVGAVVLDKNQNIILVKEFRFAIGRKSIHLPGGRYDPNIETPKRAISRELQEEIGLRPKKIEKLAEFYGSGSWVWPMSYYLCTDLVDDPKKGDIDEHIQIIKLPFKEYLSKIVQEPEGSFGDYKAVMIAAIKLGLIKINL
jgi:ADP-ribose pyrophosphatase